METTRVHAAERPRSLGPTSGNAALPDDVAAFSDSLRREHQRFLSAIGDATARLGQGARALAGTAALQHQLTRQFLDAQRSILLRHAETHAEIQRIERDAEADAAAQLAAARRRSAAMAAHPAGGLRSSSTNGVGVPVASSGTPSIVHGDIAEIVDEVFLPTEHEGAVARRQLTDLLDGWWIAEQQEARARVDDAYARAAMRRHVAGVEAAALAVRADAEAPAVAPSATRMASLPDRVCEILEAADTAHLDEVFTALLASLEAPQVAVASSLPPVPATPAPLAEGAIIRFEPSPVIATNGSDEAFQQFWAKEPAAPPARRTRWWQHVAVIVPAAAVSSLLVAVVAWVG